MVTLFLIKEARIYNRAKTVSSVSGAGKTGQLHVNPSHYTKINSKWFKDLDIRHDTIKFLAENTGKTFSNINCSNIFLNKAKEIKTKINKWDLIRLKSFFTAKETINEMRGQSTDRRYLQMICVIKG